MTADEHPRIHIKSHISDAEILGLVPDALSNDDGKIRKWVFNLRDTDVINRHLSNDRQKRLEDDEKPITADYIELDVAEDVEECVRKMLPKHARPPSLLYGLQEVEFNDAKGYVSFTKNG